MKSKTSITLSQHLCEGMDEFLANFKSRSDFIEAAIRHFIGHLNRERTDRRDLEVFNDRADALNEEAKDVLNYQVHL
jgi:metal-responsive CopG/Arc/MetJ family transcriptional regulator